MEGQGHEAKAGNAVPCEPRNQGPEADSSMQETSLGGLQGSQGDNKPHPRNIEGSDANENLPPCTAGGAQQGESAPSESARGAQGGASEEGVLVGKQAGAPPGSTSVPGVGVSGEDRTQAGGLGTPRRKRTSFEELREKLLRLKAVTGCEGDEVEVVEDAVQKLQSLKMNCEELQQKVDSLRHTLDSLRRLNDTGSSNS